MSIIWFKDCSYENKNLIGGKNASLGELYHLSKKYIDMVDTTKIPELNKASNEIINNYFILGDFCQQGIEAVVQSSAIAKDLPDASFVGQQDTYLNIKDPNELILAVKD